MNDLAAQLFLPAGILFLPLLVGCMGSVSFGIIGSYVTARRITYIAAAIAHAILGGIGAAYFVQYHWQWTWCSATLGALLAAVLAAVIIGVTTLRARHRADSIISAVMVVGMSTGLIFLAKTPGYFQPMSVLFGDILLVSPRDLWLIGGVNLTVAGVGILLYSKMLAVCFDEEFARVRGIRADWYFMALLIMTALTVVVMMQIVGIIMVIALLSLPPMIAATFSRCLWHSMVASALICIVCVAAGLALSFATDLPSGPTIVMLAAALYLATVGGRAAWHAVARQRP